MPQNSNQVTAAPAPHTTMHHHQGTGHGREFHRKNVVMSLKINGHGHGHNYGLHRPHLPSTRQHQERHHHLCHLRSNRQTL